MTGTTRRSLAALAAVVLLALLVPSSGLRAQGADPTEDGGGASIFDLAVSVREVTDGMVGETDDTVAYVSCPDCQTVALALQVVLVYGDPTVAPGTVDVALAPGCAECLTFASATQLVIGVPGPSRLTDDGSQRLLELQRSLRELEARVDELSPAELATEVDAAEAELVSIFTAEVVPTPDENATVADGGASTSAPVATTTTTTTEVAPVTTTTLEVTTTTTTTPDVTTSTTSAPDTTTTTTTEPTVTTSSTSTP